MVERALGHVLAGSGRPDDRPRRRERWDLQPRQDSYRWVTAHQGELTEKRTTAAKAMFAEHESEWAEKHNAGTSRPAEARSRIRLTTS
jgi:hypothetical protein